jgi:hypothetical protein
VDTINELIEALQEMAEQVGGDTRVRLAIQPHYPLSHVIARLGLPQFTADDRADGKNEGETTVWIALEQDRTDPYGAPAGAWGRRLSDF